MVHEEHVLGTSVKHAQHELFVGNSRVRIGENGFGRFQVEAAELKEKELLETFGGQVESTIVGVEVTLDARDRVDQLADDPFVHWPQSLLASDQLCIYTLINTLFQTCK